ncbi:cupin domain-containing protein [Gulosibacter molinativorax]|uniref:LuxR family transcriptional regulator n=1 Tax=Gulosibacter molinativorax TaxID=256821 RepID=A0ABT7C3S2_9MICO|nr:cupin domain-containing protein [Gulosibacter molinativorax]MDJ1369893.1 LuxR family transcriptional regulator [Gulosibacter molinativorax]QUY61862.1 LuxR family transcriptional regulator [Gulosibacter molinativorax]
MTKLSISALARELLHAAAEADGGRAAETVFGGHEKSLRQTVVGMIKGTNLGEHDNQDDVTVYVIQGRVRLRVGDDSWKARTGSLLIVPHARHSIEALEDSAILISVAKRPYPPGQFIA